MNYKTIALIFLIYACSEKDRTTFSILDLKVPNYYKPYNYKSFWENEGVDFTWSNYKPSNGRYKDTLSANFFTIGSSYCTTLLKISEKERLIYMKNELGYIRVRNNQKFEIYRSNLTQKMPSGKVLIQYETYFIDKQDSVSISVAYETFKVDPEKVNDYKNMVEYIEQKCDDRVTFISLTPKRREEKVVKN